MMNSEEKILEMLAALSDKVDKQSEQLNRLEANMDELDTRSLRSAVILENDVARNIRLVYEGQEMLRQKMDALAPKERVEVLEDRVVALETVIKSMSKRLAALEKAQ
jgi:polyhydroxyalkanoate synthesis regulator phasin